MNNDIGIEDLLSILLFRKWSIIVCTLLLLLIGLVWTQLMPPQYTASTSVRVKNQSIGLTGVFSSADIEQEATTLDHVAELRSSSLAMRVIQALNLESDPEFRPADIAPGLPLTEPQLSSVVDEFLKHLNVSTVDLSNVVTLSFYSEDPDKAASIANTIAKTYITSQTEQLLARSETTRSWLSQRTAQLQDEIVAIQNELVSARESRNLPITNQALSEQEAQEINRQLLALTSERNEVLAKLTRAAQLAPTDDNALLAFGAATNSIAIQNLVNRKVETQKRLAELSSEYGEEHPLMRSALAQHTLIANQLREETQKTTEILQNQLNVLRSSEAGLRGQLVNANDRVSTGYAGSIELDRLERELTSKRSLLTAVLAHFSAMENQDDLGISAQTASIISLALVPYAPSSPSKPGVIGLATILGGFLGMMWAFAREGLDKKVRTLRRLHAWIDIPVIAQIPRVPDRRRNALSSARFDIGVDSRFGNSIRKMQWNIARRHEEADAECIVVTSPVFGEGATTVATALARARSKAGRRVLLIDANFHDPGVLRAFEVSEETDGLSSLLNPAHSVLDLILYNEETGVCLLGSGVAPADPAALFSNPVFIRALQGLKAVFQSIIIDAPAVEFGPDARFVARQADTTVMVVAADGSAKQQLIDAIYQLPEESGRGRLVTVLNRSREDAVGLWSKRSAVNQIGAKGSATRDLNAIPSEGMIVSSIGPGPDGPPPGVRRLDSGLQVH